MTKGLELIIFLNLISFFINDFSGILKRTIIKKNDEVVRDSIDAADKCTNDANEKFYITRENYKLIAACEFKKDVEMQAQITRISQ